MRRVVELPPRGTLFVCTDLQGNLGDFERLVELFEAEQGRTGEAFLVVTGDLVHGPEIAPEDWPEHLGSFFEGDSPAVLALAADLQRRHPGRVHYLLGNHEHAHIGGPVVGKFFIDEAARLEELLGPERTRQARAWFATWPLVAVAPRAQLCMLHAAPHAAIGGPDDIDRIDPETAGGFDAFDPVSRSILGAILWARSTSPARASAFVRALGPTLTTAVHGHDVVREGFSVENPSQLCVSSSFGCHDGDKVYLRWDLARPAISALDVARTGLFRLWPGAPPVYLDPMLRGA